MVVKIDWLLANLALLCVKSALDVMAWVKLGPPLPTTLTIICCYVTHIIRKAWTRCHVTFMMTMCPSIRL